MRACRRGRAWHRRRSGRHRCRCKLERGARRHLAAAARAAGAAGLPRAVGRRHAGRRWDRRAGVALRVGDRRQSSRCRSSRGQGEPSCSPERNAPIVRMRARAGARAGGRCHPRDAEARTGGPRACAASCARLCGARHAAEGPAPAGRRRALRRRARRGGRNARRLVVPANSIRRTCSRRATRFSEPKNIKSGQPPPLRVPADAPPRAPFE